MRFVNDYFNDAANAAVAFSFHRGFVAVVSSRYKKKKKKANIVPQLLLSGIVLFLNLCNWFIQIMIDKSQE